VTDAHDAALHAADVEHLERRIMELALERTGARSGALFLWDARRKGLALGFHVVEGAVIDIPDALVVPARPGEPAGVAMHVLDRAEPYLTNDTTRDPHYAPYFLPVLSIAAAPILYQGRAIGVLSVSARDRGAFEPAHLGELEALAASAATFLRRAQLHRAAAARGRPFLIKGLSPAWLEVERRIEQVAPTRAPVLIHGESGTGKELVAHAIHFNSRRAAAPLIVVNCAAIPETLLESTLFGHVKGAFTGATQDKLGELARADGGTLFLDEIGELPLGLQAKLLRAVEYGELQPLGSDRAPVRVDVRILCATHRDLPAMVRDRRFRDDLYYRIGVMRLEVPPLRSYKDNLELLAHVFLRDAAARHERRVTRLAPDALAALAAYDFPGNVRELKNAIEHAVILAAGDELTAADLPEPIAPAPRAPRAPRPRRKTLRQLRDEWLAPLETAYLSELLASHDGHVRRAAAAAGVDAVTLYRLLARRGLKPPRRGTS
jgi:DNA-binding NtrC family response regulator